MIGYVSGNLAICCIFRHFFLHDKNILFYKRGFTGTSVRDCIWTSLQCLDGLSQTQSLNRVDWFNIVGSGYVKFLRNDGMPLNSFRSYPHFRVRLTAISERQCLIIGILLGTTAMQPPLASLLTVFNLEAVQIEQGEAELSRGIKYWNIRYDQDNDAAQPELIPRIRP